MHLQAPVHPPPITDMYLKHFLCSNLTDVGPSVRDVKCLFGLLIKKKVNSFCADS